MGSITSRLVDASARRPSGWVGRRTYGGQRGARKRHLPDFDRLLEWLGPLEGDRCLEIGPGGGALLARVLEAGATTAAGLDCSGDMLALSMARNSEALAREQLQLKLGDAEQIPWPDQTFNAAYAANVFVFIERPSPSC